MSKLNNPWLLICMLMVNTAAIAQDVYRSSKEQVATIELFTSHGCSSCPPADKWLRQYVDHPGLWNDVIPLAFHVDYWNYLGWPDEFSTSAFTDRQQRYAQSGRVRSVYTPGLVVKGREWRGFFRRSQPDLSSGDEVGVLTLTAADETATIEFAAVESLRDLPLQANVAILGFGIETPIGGGENRGRSLAEDFVVLGHRVTNISNKHNWQLEFPSTVDANAERTAVVAWVNDSTSPAPLQITGGWLQ